MICPHCKKRIIQDDSALMKRVGELREKGYTFRDIEKVLFGEGYSISFTTIHRRFQLHERGKR